MITNLWSGVFNTVLYVTNTFVALNTCFKTEYKSKFTPNSDMTKVCKRLQTCCKNWQL